MLDIYANLALKVPEELNRTIEARAQFLKGMEHVHGTFPKEGLSLGFIKTDENMGAIVEAGITPEFKAQTLALDEVPKTIPTLPVTQGVKSAYKTFDNN
ncbi:MAG: hypothetical protein FWF23_04235 [Alphaproteobacteria bacterium]|nr:hypothetical protein [Alphaproteobacteria bacterium]MCL2505335.1 hypothetical protein [Alphaproteobacteria bacterium]